MISKFFGSVASKVRKNQILYIYNKKDVQRPLFPQINHSTGCFFKLRFSLSYRDVEELMTIRGVKVDHATIQRWVFKFAPLVEQQFNIRKKPVWKRWRMDETYIKVKGQWKYLYRAVDKNGNTVDFLLTKKRQRISAHKFLINAIQNNKKLELINIDKSGSNNQAIKLLNRRTFSKIKIRQCKYLNNIIEQDHRKIKWRLIQGLGFKNFQSAKRTIS